MQETVPFVPESPWRRGKVLPAETGDGCVIGRRAPFKQIHEVDVPEAYLLDAAGTVYLIHVCVDQDVKQLMR